MQTYTTFVNTEKKSKKRIKLNNTPAQDGVFSDPPHTHVSDAVHATEHAIGSTIRAVGKGVKVAEHDAVIVEKKAKKFWYMLGPGLTTGASDDDPSGIATYSQTGAQYSFSLIWLALFTFPLMATVQEMCARIGMVTGQGLAANIRQHYSKKAIYIATFLLLVANIFNIGADFGAMAKALQLLFPLAPFGLTVIFFGLGGLLMQVFMSYARYAKYLKYLALVLLSYVITAFYVQIDWSQLLSHTVIPHFDFTKNQILLVCGILGTTISPYLFFWQTSQEIEEKKLIRGMAFEKKHRNDMKEMSAQDFSASREAYETVLPASTPKQIQRMRVDVWSGMFISNVAMFFIIAVCSATLFSNGITTIETAADAAGALRPFAGEFAYLLFTVGIIGVGLLAVPVLAGSAAYAVSESFGWKFGLNRKLKEARAFYGVIGLSVIVGIGFNFIGLHPMKALIYSAVLNGLVAPVILYFIVRLSSRKDVMGKHKNKKGTTVVGWITVSFMSVTALATIYTLFS
ncbi:MAG: iron transporter [Candidatus Magasanikbacteria bacterium CG_4_10_14_0_2_um_filter_41_10]|uniref:Iron transporter n=1 Tax=Candidatus Magasanikbacteria bacterium CG_4_10_14_0_2_um_filter_41_10 TaxID=1974638 RepID=A0A2M7V4N1_9BACT|nr:MAG: iron transporter [Candidatus Magasanikbacteria bacterium CG_4_10_14_0_2_um_filter_41_10]